MSTVPTIAGVRAVSRASVVCSNAVSRSGIRLPDGQRSWVPALSVLDGSGPATLTEVTERTRQPDSIAAVDEPPIVLHPRLIIVSGQAGSGKTTLAHRLATRIGCPAI